MIALYIALGIIALILIIPIFISTDMEYEKTMDINANPETVWPYVSQLKEMDRWSPWVEKDPNMKKTFTGTDGTPGASQGWEGNKAVGQGSQTLISLDPPNRVETRLDFIKPFKSTAQAWINLEKITEGTRVAWGFKSKIQYPMNIMKLFINFKKNMDKEFGGGLNKLKKLAENKQ